VSSQRWRNFSSGALRELEEPECGAESEEVGGRSRHAIQSQARTGLPARHPVPEHGAGRVESERPPVLEVSPLPKPTDAFTTLVLGRRSRFSLSRSLTTSFARVVSPVSFSIPTRSPVARQPS
jgi:hypothetical protein